MTSKYSYTRGAACATRSLGGQLPVRFQPVTSESDVLLYIRLLSMGVFVDDDIYLLWKSSRGWIN